MNPFDIFQEWYKEETALFTDTVPAACCLTSIGEDGYPNSRMLSLKDIKEDTFIITGPMSSRKGKEIQNNPKVSINFWWVKTEKQVRVQGDAFFISETEANYYFQKRNHNSKVVSTIFKQGEAIQNFSELESRFAIAKEELKERNIPKPQHWSGIRIQPKRIELMAFKKSRLHLRRLFTNQNGAWHRHYLQP